MASPFLQGFQVGANVASDRANRALRLQELKSQQQLRMLQEQQIAQQLAIQMENRNLAIQERADMAKAITAAQQATQPFIQVPMEGQEGLGEMNPPIMEVPNPNPMTQEQAAMRFVLPVISQYRPDKVPDFLEGVALAEYRKRADTFSPSVKQLPHPAGGAPVDVVQTSPNQVQVLQPGAERMQSTIGREMADLKKLEQSGDTNAVQVFKEMQARRDASKGEIVTIGPDGSVNITRGITPGELTNQQRGSTKLQSDKLVDAATRVGELVAQADKLFGPVAAGKTVVVDRLLANIFPGLAEGQRIQGRTKAALVKEQIIRSLGEGQGQLSNKDIQRFEQALFELGSVKETAESPERVRNILRSLQKEMARDALQKTVTLGGEVSPQVLKMMDPAVVLQEFRNGRITKEQLQKAFDDTVHQEDAKAVLETIQ